MGTVTAKELMPGMYVEDDFTDWARVVRVKRNDDTVVVDWSLASGRDERHMRYDATALFTPIDGPTS